MCKSGLDSDGLSTACFVLGEEKSKELLEKYDAEALFIDQDGNITMTEGMREYFKEK
jgi:thiamine biosynthesis lipoprotein